MPRRGVAATSLGILLLSVASYIPVCDLSCSFKQIHSACPSGAGNSVEAQQRDSMPADMAMGDRDAVPQSDPAGAMRQMPLLSRCPHEACGMAAALAFVATKADPARLYFGHAVAKVATGIRQAGVNLRFAKGEAPPAQVPVFDPPVSNPLRL
jgi:hypothetical protein